MGVKHFSCDKLALEEIRDALREAKREGQFVALLGDNKNVLGFGFVEDVNDATAELELDLSGVMGDSVTIPGIPADLIDSIDSDLEFTVNLCCVCSIVTSDNIVLLIILGLLLGYLSPFSTLAP
ncbi:hypothetical protein FZW96_15015 [Bacillus sp. BGMRC 2118]|nr:hypothetical protein FZW96_15015 [Bacillus sp. BGMRC 2118]